ncbi:MAG: RNA polymerase subunit sigma, partial [Ruminococcus sp.]|nr:RNA polymerase subunit sigma [Ruminococcus sp.]
MSADMEKYYRENGRKVFLYLMTLCGNADTAEELTQETFYRALRSLKKYKGE